MSKKPMDKAVKMLELCVKTFCGVTYQRKSDAKKVSKVCDTVIAFIKQAEDAK